MTRRMTVTPKGLKLRILFMQHRCIRVKEGTKLKQDTFSFFEATTVDTLATTTREHHDSLRPWPAMTVPIHHVPTKRPDACQKDRGCGLTCRAPISDFLRMRVQI